MDLCDADGWRSTERSNWVGHQSWFVGGRCGHAFRKDAHARYFGTELADDSITAGADAGLGRTSFTVWLAHTQK